MTLRMNVQWRLRSKVQRWNRTALTRSTNLRSWQTLILSSTEISPGHQSKQIVDIRMCIDWAVLLLFPSVHSHDPNDGSPFVVRNKPKKKEKEWVLLDHQLLLDLFAPSWIIIIVCISIQFQEGMAPCHSGFTEPRPWWWLWLFRWWLRCRRRRLHVSAFSSKGSLPPLL